MDNKKIKLSQRFCIAVELYFYKQRNGTRCKSCKEVQGLPNKKLGIRKYYCQHVIKTIQNKMRPINNKAVAYALTEIKKDLDANSVNQEEVKE